MRPQHLGRAIAVALILLTGCGPERRPPILGLGKVSVQVWGEPGASAFRASPADPESGGFMFPASTYIRVKGQADFRPASLLLAGDRQVFGSISTGESGATYHRVGTYEASAESPKSGDVIVLRPDPAIAVAYRFLQGAGLIPSTFNVLELDGVPPATQPPPVFLMPPSPSPTPSSRPLPSPLSPRPYSSPTAATIEEFVRSWYAQIDAQAPVEALLAMLYEQVKMNFRDDNLIFRDQFVGWYEVHRSVVRSSSHRIDRVEVNGDNLDFYDVRVEGAVRTVDVDGGASEARFVHDWTVEAYGGSLRVDHFIERDADDGG